MTCNVGKTERVIRVLAGLGILSLVFIGPQTVWAWIGAVPLLTGLIGYCPAYSLIGFNTCKTS
jgi:hypothetical protein